MDYKNVLKVYDLVSKYNRQYGYYIKPYLNIYYWDINIPQDYDDYDKYVLEHLKKELNAIKIYN